MGSSKKHAGVAPAFLSDDWHLIEDGFSPASQAVSETLLAQANGYLGTRGTFEEPLAPGIDTIEGTYLNGVYLREAIHYDEAAYGFATHNNKMILVPDAKRFTLTAGNETLVQGTEQITSQRRTLDMRNGLLMRETTFAPKAGGTLVIRSRRFVSMADQGLMAIEYSLTSEGYTGPVTLQTGVSAIYGGKKEGFDPRAGALSVEACLDNPQVRTEGDATLVRHRIHGSDHAVLTGYRLDTVGDMTTATVTGEGYWGTEIGATLKPGDTLTVTKFASYGDGLLADEAALFAAAAARLETAKTEGFQALLEAHSAHFDRFWQVADIGVDSDGPVQQGLRFGQFHLFQSAGRDGKRALAAKGLSGPGYDGHYFWDTEIYAVPFFVFSQPDVARSLLEYRVGKLDAARARARTMGHATGALFAWRTIGGEECSSYFPAGTGQYHINAAIAYACLQYIKVTGDRSFIANGGAELLFETARIWMGLGHFNQQKGGRFCIHEVTGPDEYTAMTDNNLYTNMMAQYHLEEAVALAGTLRQDDPAFFEGLATRVGLTDDELAVWADAARLMHLPYNEALGIHEQCDGFLDKPEWDFANTPASHYPLLLHYHPLVIYRHQVLKQPDVVLAQILLPDRFGASDKRRNLAYYEPRTTHDSTLSACMHAIANTESGSADKAYEFFEETYRMDLENRHRNTHYGVHIACMAGSWMAVTYGFAGMRFTRDMLSFAPSMPKGWRSYHFKVKVGTGVVALHIDPVETRYTLMEGDTLAFNHHGTCVNLNAGDSVSLPTSSS